MAFNYTPVVITRSNTSFVKVGEKTHIKDINGIPHMWSDFCNRYEKVSWAAGFWSVEYEVR